MEIQISKVEKQNDGSQIYEAFNKWGDTNTLNFPLVAEPLNNESPQPMFEVVDCRLQGFVGPEGFVTSHEEDPGVIEMYFILSGKVEATRDGEVYELFGRFNNLKQIKSIGELVLDDDLTSPNLRIENK
ncbi:hypothetical protein KC660_00485, partial [Candidatus Dojkabacteria bacterium]|nr:hypothetical protein [Candidatus Dojkabacteria bacterium]